MAASMRPSQMPGSIITPPLIPTHVKAFQDSRSSKVPANYQAVSSSKTTSDSDIVICGTQAAAGRQFVGVLLDNPEFNTLDRYQSIACEKRYIDASFEELRLLDYTNQLRFAGNLTKEVSAQALSNPSSFGKYVHSGYRKMSSSPKRPVAETGVEQGMVPEGMIQRSSANTALDPSAELEYYFNVLGVGQVARSKSSWEEEIKTTPLFKWLVHRPSTITAAPIDPGPSTLTPPPTPSSPATAPVASPPRFEQYSVFGHELRSAGRPQLLHEEIPIFLNTNAPWSAFLCGSQGSGKSYTLSCILESCLMQSSSLGRTSSPMAGIVFAYDPHASNMACEAASLASHLPVNVLVSPSNYLDMKQMYEKLGCKGRINVQPLFLNQSNLNTKRILKLMAFGGGDGPTPLYMEVLINILKEMRIGKSEAVHGFDYALFLAKIRDQKFDAMQKGPMNLRLSLLDSFMDTGSFAAKLPANKSKNLFEAKPGSLTIVDLSDPFVDPPSACVLFDICLALFLENRSAVGKLIALDEAHKFMGETTATAELTDSLFTVIREQRHRGARVVIATQEPTVSPKLLDLCSMTFVHRFTSPEWLTTLSKHLAGASRSQSKTKNTKHIQAATTIDEGGEENVGEKPDLMDEIVNLNIGESLLFSPSAMLDVVEGKPRKLGMGYVKFKTRLRVTVEGGRSVLAGGRS